MSITKEQSDDRQIVVLFYPPGKVQIDDVEHDCHDFAKELLSVLMKQLSEAGTAGMTLPRIDMPSWDCKVINVEDGTEFEVRKANE